MFISLKFLMDFNNFTNWCLCIWHNNTQHDGLIRDSIYDT